MPAPIVLDIATPQTVSLSFATPAVAVSSIVVAAERLVLGAAAVTAAGVVSAGKIIVTLSGGSDGERYAVTVRASDAGGAVTERMITVAALDPAWTMADASAGWLSIIEFVERFGLDEAVRATDADGSGVIDRRYLIGALRDAQAEIQMKLAARYALPLSVIPDAIKTAMADLAAVRLYRHQAPESISDAAKVARATLNRIADGKDVLPGVAGVAVQNVAESSDPILYHTAGDASRFGMEGY